VRMEVVDARPTVRRRRALVAIALLGTFVGVAALQGNRSLRGEGTTAGSSEWAIEHYGDPDARGFKRRKIIDFDFLGRTMFVHRGAKRHFLRLERLFEARAPAYAAAVAAGELDDWSYQNRDVRGGGAKSNHSFGIAIDINALANPLGTEGDMPVELVRQWRLEGGGWGGDWSRPDPMHFETHLTPTEIRQRYRSDGAPRDWYVEELTGGG
jgi:hypothetical protein